MNEMLEKLGQNAKDAETVLRNLSTNDKNKTLEAVAKALVAHTDEILKANALDVENGKKNQMPEGLIDRLMLTPERIEGMADGLRQLTGLEDPIGEVTGMKKRPNGLLIGQKRVPLGVIGIIYEARPNVTSDAFGLCFKTGNVVILKGGSDAIHSNTAIVNCIREALKACGITEDAIQLIQDTSRETAAGIYEAEPVCGCTDPTWRKRTDQSSGKPEYDPCHRDRNRKLPYLCGRDCRSSDGSGYCDQCKDPACGRMQCMRVPSCKP